MALQPTTINKDFNPRWNLISLCFASFIIITGFSVIIPFFPFYAESVLFEFDILGFTFGLALQIGIITAASKFMQIFLTPAYGELSDEVGRKPLILVGMSLYTLLMVGYGFASDFSTLIILRALQGIGSASVWPIGEALVVDTSQETTKDKRGKNLGWYMFSMLAGLTLGPFLGYGIYSIFLHLGFGELSSYRFTFTSVGIFGLLATILVIVFVKDPRSLETEQQSIISLYGSSIKAMFVKTLHSPVILMRSLSTEDEYRTRSIYTLYIVALVNGLGVTLLLPIGALFLEHYYGLDEAGIVLIMGVVGALALFGTVMGGYLSDKFGQKRTVWTSGILGGASMFLLGFQSTILIILVIFTLRRLFFSILTPSFRSLQSSIIPEEVRGKEFGVVQAANNLGSVIGPILGGYIYDLFFMVNIDIGNGIVFLGAGVTFAVSGLLAIIAMLLVIFFVNQFEVKPTFESESSIVA
ncbi:MAG: MFS transporter [Candidatus Hodarchaeales archaeon]|jgi:DHA1 family multidrug resistance protein-like MFS transporter